MHENELKCLFLLQHVPQLFSNFYHAFLEPPKIVHVPSLTIYHSFIFLHVRPFKLSHYSSYALSYPFFWKRILLSSVIINYGETHLLRVNYKSLRSQDFPRHQQANSKRRIIHHLTYRYFLS